MDDELMETIDTMSDALTHHQSSHTRQITVEADTDGTLTIRSEGSVWVGTMVRAQ